MGLNEGQVLQDKIMISIKHNISNMWFNFLDTFYDVRTIFDKN